MTVNFGMIAREIWEEKEEDYKDVDPKNLEGLPIDCIHSLAVKKHLERKRDDYIYQNLFKLSLNIFHTPN